jgi:hypothetical protein
MSMVTGCGKHSHGNENQTEISSFRIHLCLDQTYEGLCFSGAVGCSRVEQGGGLAQV